MLLARMRPSLIPDAQTGLAIVDWNPPNSCVLVMQAQSKYRWDASSFLLHFAAMEFLSTWKRPASMILFRARFVQRLPGFQTSKKMAHACLRVNLSLHGRDASAECLANAGENSGAKIMSVSNLIRGARVESRNDSTSS
jgi:hypothetical protein